MKNVISIILELRSHIARKYKTQKAAAAAWGVSAAFVSSVLSGKKAPNDVMLKDAGFMKVEQQPYYVKIKK